MRARPKVAARLPTIATARNNNGRRRATPQSQNGIAAMMASTLLSWSKRTVGQGARRVCTNSFLVLIFDFEVLEAGTSGSGDDASSSDIVLVWVPDTSCYMLLAVMRRVCVLSHSVAVARGAAEQDWLKVDSSLRIDAQHILRWSCWHSVECSGPSPPASCVDFARFAETLPAARAQLGRTCVCTSVLREAGESRAYSHIFERVTFIWLISDNLCPTSFSSRNL